MRPLPTEMIKDFLSYSKELRKKLRKVANPSQSNIERIAELNYDIARYEQELERRKPLALSGSTDIIVPVSHDRGDGETVAVPTETGDCDSHPTK